MQTLHVGTEYFLDISFGKMFNWGKKKNTRFEGFFIDREYYNEVRIVWNWLDLSEPNIAR